MLTLTDWLVIDINILIVNELQSSFFAEVELVTEMHFNVILRLQTVLISAVFLFTITYFA
jgi:hypothetical protein